MRGPPSPSVSASGSATRNSVRPGSRLDGNLAVVVADEAPDDVEAETGALPHRLGGEERIEDALADLLRECRRRCR